MATENPSSLRTTVKPGLAEGLGERLGAGLPDVGAPVEGVPGSWVGEAGADAAGGRASSLAGASLPPPSSIHAATEAPPTTAAATPTSSGTRH
ncbi:hypothetical protein ACFWJT_25605 [Streptomyces sp. NPDC127069]|uniref:hypothetical protein n=1 Tax=Streptomyces sp. NPDC127069 TaxID=3347128 RepID=UPI00364D7664